MEAPLPNHFVDLQSQPDVMNDPAFETNNDQDKPPGEGDTCRICRSEGTVDEPLFYPCKCSGSIKFVHQDCLMEWLSHSNKKHCELCKTPFRFTKLYHSHMPTTLPIGVFLSRACIHLLQYFLTWIRATIVAAVWLIALPWCIRWSWRGLFWLLDAGWARDAWLAKMENQTLQAQNNTSHTSLAKITPNPVQPITLNLSRFVLNVLLNPWRPMSVETANTSANITYDTHTAVDSTLFSDVSAFNSITASPSTNRFILDVLEGQVVTFLVVIAFILVFLIREWVVQQQPLINAAAANDREEENQPVVGNLDANPPALGPEEADDVPSDTETTLFEDLMEEPLAGPVPPVELPAEPVAATRYDNHSDELMAASTIDMTPSSSLQADATSTGSDSSWVPVGTSPQAEAPLNHENGQHQSIRSQDNVEHSFGSSNSFGDVGEHAQLPQDPGSESFATFSGRVEELPGSSEPSDGISQNDPASMSELNVVPAGDLTSTNNLEVHEDYPGQDNDNPEVQVVATASGEEPAAERQEPPQVEEPHAGGMQRLFDWFWADIVPDVQHDEPVPAPVEEVVRDDADLEGLVGFVDPDLDHDGDVDANAIQAQDQEVLQAAADAGLDADGMDDVEDLEGILELIGMQGPLVGLLQTAMFCGVLITTTLWAAIGTPYLFGKLALLGIGDPITFLILGPMRFVSFTADSIVDIAIYLSSLVAYFASQGMISLSSMISTTSRFGFRLESLEYVATRAHSATNAAAERLSIGFFADESFEAGFMLVSVHAHASLRTLRAEIALVLTQLGSTLAALGSLLTTPREGLTLLTSMVHNEMRSLGTNYVWMQNFFRNLPATIKNGSLTMTTHGQSGSIDPSLAYWNATDRCLTVLAGYALVAVVGTMYLLRREPLFSSPNLRKAEKNFTDFLKQAGGVLKVILIISIEMLAFPLYCGLLLDCALLPLFEHASISSRLTYAYHSPCMFAFVHWFIGTCYMFHFALFVSMCRRVMRNGVLYFIRDPDDPTFHPVRDVLERNVTSQLRKIAFSAMVYGALVILCLGGVVWSFAHAFDGIFPIRWATPEPVMEFPVDFLAYNLLAPVVGKFLLPSDGVEMLFRGWLKRCARFLRLSHFMFGERQNDEEVRDAQTPWYKVFMAGGKINAEEIVDTSEPTTRPPNGRYVRVPASDQVRIPKGNRVFLEVTEENERVDGQPDRETGMHGKQNKNFTMVYVPPWFRFRIGLFIGSLWVFAAAIGVGVTILPIASGGFLLQIALPHHVHANDLYAFTTGLLSLGGSLFMMLRGRKLYQQMKGPTTMPSISEVIKGSQSHAGKLLRSVYVYGFALIVVPSLFALVLQLYLILPLHTYTSSLRSGLPSMANNTEPAVPQSLNQTQSAAPMSDGFSSILAGHTIHILQDWTLGFFYGRVVLRLLLLSRQSRPAAALRLIIRDGYGNPNARLATRAFIIPTLLVFSAIILFPPVLAWSINTLLYGMSLPRAVRVKVYRYIYPVCASQAFAAWCLWEVVKATRRWRNRIKDEVYLIGERLHNFGERKPPEGSKSVVRKT